MLYSVEVKEFKRREPGEWTHGEVIAGSLPGSELPGKIGERKETMAVIEAFLILTVAAFYFAVMTGCIRTDQLMPNA